MSAELKKQKIQKLVEMGERVHMLARTGQLNDDELVRLSQQVTKLDTVLNAHLGKALPVKENGVCPQCNAPFEGSFCGGCGLNIDAFFSQPITTCAVCELVVDEADVFCGVCGTKRGR